MASYETTWRQITAGDPVPAWARVARSALAAAAVGYGAGLRVYRSCYELGLVRPERLPCPVVGIGNLTLGGTGKTTTVEWVARELLRLRAAPAILSRGYGSAARDAVTVVADRTGIRCPVEESGDEPQMLARALPGIPVLVGRNRRLTGRAACGLRIADCGLRIDPDRPSPVPQSAIRNPQSICVLDDSFQYWRLYKDLEILLVDSTRPLAREHLFPRGSLREPVSAACRAHAAVLTHADRAPAAEKQAQAAAIRRDHPELPIAEARHRPGPVRPLAGGDPARAAELAGDRWLAISSLGDPASFPATLAGLGIGVDHFPFPDHHRYTAPEIEAVAHRAAGYAGILTTEKDAVKLDPAWFGDTPCWVLTVELEFLAGGEAIRDLIRQCLAKTA
jgi:tetraacyldisaccharide 4'-kinase